MSAICDSNNGRCKCRPNYQGEKCDRCAAGYYGFPICSPCNCNYEGSTALDCEPRTGDCNCKTIYTGRQCDKCLTGFYGFPKCSPCNCNPSGTKRGPGGQPGDCSPSNNVSCGFDYIESIIYIYE